MNEILILKRTNSDPDDGMFSCYQGVVNGYGEEGIGTFWEGSRADRFIGGFLRKVNKSVDEYSSTEESATLTVDRTIEFIDSFII